MHESLWYYTRGLLGVGVIYVGLGVVRGKLLGGVV